MAPFRCVVTVSVCAAVAFSTQGALAISASDVMEKMTEKERFGYLTGLVDMLSYQHVLAGNQGRAKCISVAFYKKPDDAWRLVGETFAKFPDKAAEGLMVVLMNRSCGSDK